MPAATEPDDDAMLHELEELLCAIAEGRPVNRAEATSYSKWRSRLLTSRLRPLLPGFLYQCLSLLRFKDFITLYHPAIEQRARFVREAFDPGRSLLGIARRGDPPVREESQSHRWML